jgi:hypothetical protein
MNPNNNQPDKLKIIEQLIMLNDDKVFEQVEILINKKLQRTKLRPLSPNDLEERALKSESDIKANRVYSQEQAEELSKNW